MGAASSGDRIDAAWLRDPALVAIFDAMAAGGHEVRVVGGAVRDTLLRPDGPASPPDVDLATTATPDETITAAEAAGLKPVPTGVDHGTVTIIAAGTPFEVTTLRRDVETDGRHAVVSFTTDWAEDAARRDFTINALFCDATGQVFDPVGDGRQDLAARRLRFIGDPEARITEDYLRTVRLFRFLAELEGFQADRGAFHATTNAREGLRTLSGERLQREFAKLFVAPHAAHAIRQMQRFGVFAELLPFAPAPG
ncbi:MAG: CCA tRNA nucleotidyltransferase, partial [Pseudomonadota bacterium]